MMSTTPTPAPRSKRTAPNPPVSQRQPDQTRTGNVTEETQGPDRQASSGSDESKPPRPPPPQSRSSPQDGMHNKNKMPGNAKHKSTEDKNLAAGQDRDHAGQISTMGDTCGEMSTSFIEAWSNLNLEIQCQGQKPLKFDATSVFGPPALLQFAFTSEAQKDVSFDSLRKQNILLEIKKDTLIFTYNKEKQCHWSEQDLKYALINTLAKDILGDLSCITEKKDTVTGLAMLENIKKTKPAVLRRGQVLMYLQGTDIFVVGTERSIRKLSSECHSKETNSTVQPKMVCVSLSDLSFDDIDFIIKLELTTDIESVIPDVKFSVEKKSIQGTEQNVDRAFEMLNEYLSSAAKKEVVFKDSFCAKAFLDNNSKNETLCDFVKNRIYKCKKVAMKKCYIDVYAGDTPRVYVYCMSQEKADTAAVIVSECVCLNRIAKNMFMKINEDISNWFDKKRLYVVHSSEKEVFTVTTCDITEKLNILIAEKMDITKQIPIPEFASRYLTQYGSSFFEKVSTEYKVSVNLAENAVSLSGLPENVSKAKHFIKDSYAGERVNVEIDISQIDKQKSQFDTIAEKHKCCWNAKPNSGDRKGMLKDAQYRASWCNPPTNAKLTVVEGSAADIEFDVLLVFVTDSFFPTISKSHLQEGFERFVNFTCEELKRRDGNKIPLGMLGQFPQHILKGFIKSKEVMYLVVQKSTEIEGFSRSLPLAPDLAETIRKASFKNELSSIGIPIETDLEGTFKESELCRQISAAWVNNWSWLKNMPELFLCSTVSGNVVEVVDETFKYSRGFSKQSFSTLKEEVSDISDFVHAEVKIGDLLHSEAEVIVNTTAKTLDLHQGYISSLILKHAGDSVQEECNKQYPKGIEHAEVAVTGSGNLRQRTSVKNILHSSLQGYKCQAHDKAMDCVKRFVKNCLYTAERLDVSSIAFPALGTGKLSYPGRDVAAAMFDAVEEYKRDVVSPKLRHIYFMVFAGDKTVCEVFQNEEWRRHDQNKRKRKEMDSSDNETFLKKTIPMVEGAVEFKVHVNVQCIPSEFVVVNFNNVVPGKETRLMLKSAKETPPSWNDELVSCQNIASEGDLKRMTKEIIIKTDEERVTGLLFFPLIKSSFPCSVGQQIKCFTAEVESLTQSYMEPRRKLLKYLRKIWFPVDESGFSSAENCLLSGTSGRLLKTLTFSSSWEKLPVSETSHRAFISVIGPSREVVQAAVTDMKSILKQTQSSSQAQGKQLSSTVVFKPDKDKVYPSLGFGNPQIDHSQQGNPELRKNPKIPPKDETGTKDKKMQTFVSQGACPKQTGVSQKSSIDPSGPLKTGTDRQDSKDKESSLLDALEVTANINQGIVAFLRVTGEDKLSEWTERVTKVFQVQFQTTVEKLTVHGSFFQVKVFQDYLNNDFPKFPEETIEAEDDKSESKEDTYVTDKSSVVTNSEDGIVFEFQVGNVQVYVYKGDLTKVKVDCIVSSASSYLSGSMGLEKAVLDAAGGQVRQECQTYIQQKRRLSSGEVLVTSGGNLRCKKIIHFSMPDSMSLDGERKLFSSISGCINAAEKEGLQSIAIPALGSVSLSASNRLLEKFGVCLYHAVSTHGEKEDSSLKVVHFVDKNNKLVSSVLEALSAKFSCLRINQATIYVAQGNVTATKADAIVVFQDSNFNFNSKIAKDVAALSGDQYSQALELLKDQAPGIGTVFRSKATGDMATLCASVLHAVILEDFGDEKKKGIPTTQEIKMTCKDIFAKSRKINVSTLGVPVFEVEELNKTEYLSAMAEFVFEYFCSTEEPSVKEIHFLSEDMDAVRSFVECLQKQITQVEKLKKENKLAFHFATKKETEIY